MTLNPSSSTASTPILTDDSGANLFLETPAPNNLNKSRLADSLFEDEITPGLRKCKRCNTVIKTQKTSKGALINHYKSQHSNIWTEAQAALIIGNTEITKDIVQPTILQSLTGLINQDQFDSLLLKWIIKDQQYFSVVENEAFKSLIGACCKRM